MRRFLLAFLALAGPPAAASAQSVAPDSGVRIRITTYGSPERKGTLVSLTPDSVSYHPEFMTALHTVPLAQVSALDMSRGYVPSMRSLFKGVGIGGLVGVGLSAAFFLGPSNTDGPPAALGAIVYGPLLIGAGMVVGGIIGAQNKVETWSPIYPEGREASLLVGPARHGGFAMGVSVPFDVPGDLEEVPADSPSETPLR